MFIVHVAVKVNPGDVEAFKAASIANARASLREEGVARFDVIQDAGDSAHFLLVEVYRSPEGAAAHKETAHYATWRDTVASMMAVPRQSTKYANVFPDEDGWDS